LSSSQHAEVGAPKRWYATVAVSLLDQLPKLNLVAFSRHMDLLTGVIIQCIGAAQRAKNIAPELSNIRPGFCCRLSLRPSPEGRTLPVGCDGRGSGSGARGLGISFHTVKFHVAAVLEKLDADTRTEAVMKAAQLGIVML
jgi:hypothetical protein